MTQDFFLPTQIIPCPTVREESGLAMSSRNALRRGKPMIRLRTCSRPQRPLLKHRGESGWKRRALAGICRRTLGQAVGRGEFRGSASHRQSAGRGIKASNSWADYPNKPIDVKDSFRGPWAIPPAKIKAGGCAICFPALWWPSSVSRHRFTFLVRIRLHKCSGRHHRGSVDRTLKDLKLKHQIVGNPRLQWALQVHV